MIDRDKEGEEECKLENIHEEVEVGVIDCPVMFNPDEYRALTKHMNPYLQPVPHDLLRFDCAEPEHPLREILYETDCWAKKEPTGAMEWDIPQGESDKEDVIEEFIRPKQETGYRATYLHSRLMGSDLPKEETYEKARSGLVKQGPSFTQEKVTARRDFGRKLGKETTRKR